MESIKCPKCGAIVKIDFCDPAFYGWTCPCCGQSGVNLITSGAKIRTASGFIKKLDDDELDKGIGVTTTNATDNSYSTINAVPSIYSTSTQCEICGEKFKYDEKHMHICPKCREAVVKIRKLLDGQQSIQILSVDDKEPKSDSITFPNGIARSGVGVRLF